MELRLAIGLCVLLPACVSPPVAARVVDAGRVDASSAGEDDAGASTHDAGSASAPVVMVIGMRGTSGVPPAVAIDAGPGEDAGWEPDGSLPPYDAGGMPCPTNPCMNGGDCLLMLGGILCVCPPPYYGAVCQLSD